MKPQEFSELAMYGKRVVFAKRFDEGYIIPTSTIKVLSLVNGKFKIANATNIYKEKVKNLFLVKTKRGRVLKITGKHQLLSFDKGLDCL